MGAAFNACMVAVVIHVIWGVAVNRNGMVTQRWTDSLHDAITTSRKNQVFVSVFIEFQRKTSGFRYFWYQVMFSDSTFPIASSVKLP